MRRRRLPLRLERQGRRLAAVRLYDDEGLLHHVGFTSSLKSGRAAGADSELEALVEPPGFTGNAPGGPSRWSTERSAEWQPLKPKLVVEVDTITSPATASAMAPASALAARQAPLQCTFDQLRVAGRGNLRLVKFLRLSDQWPQQPISAGPKDQQRSGQEAPDSVVQAIHHRSS